MFFILSYLTLEAEIPGCGTKVTCSNEETVLTIAGEGEGSILTIKSQFDSIKTTIETIKITNLEEIGDNAFKGFTKITAITIPASVTKLGATVFEGCEKLATITYEGTTEGLSSIPLGDLTLSKSLAIITPIGYANANFGTLPVTKKVGTDAEDVISITYDIKGDNALTIKGAADMSDAKEADQSILKNCVEAKTVTITDLTKIGSYAFKGFTKIAAITIPASVTKLGTTVFEGCEKLETITYEGTTADLASIPLGALTLQGSTLTVKTSIDYAPANFGNIKVDEKNGKDGNSITITYNIKGNNALIIKGDADMSDAKGTGQSILKNCVGAKTVAITGLTKIGSYAFEGFTQIAEITIPESVISIGASAFKGCKVLANAGNFEIPSKVTTVGANAFENCEALVKVAFKAPSKSSHKSLSGGASAFTIGASAFSGCIALTEITLPVSETFTELSTLIFNGCSAMASITIPATVTSIGENAFQGCAKLAKIKYLGKADLTTATGLDNLPEVSKLYVDLATFPADTLNKKPVLKEGKDSATVNILYEPATQTITLTGTAAMEENDGAKETSFTKCKSATKVIVSDGITTIGTYCFRELTSLEEITIAASVKTIKANAFTACTKLQKITYLGASEPSLADSGIKKEGVTVYVKDEYTQKENKFAGIPVIKTSGKFGKVDSVTWNFDVESGILTIKPEESNAKGNMDPVKDANPFETIKGITKSIVLDGITMTSENCFKGFNELVSVDIKTKEFKLFGANSFEGCIKLPTITIQATVHTIEKDAFKGCNALESITYLGTDAEKYEVFPKTSEKLPNLKKAYVTPEYPANKFWGVSATIKSEYGTTNKVTWELEKSTGLFTITNGKDNADGIIEANKPATKSPFDAYKANVKVVFIGEGIKSICESCFKGFAQLENVTFMKPAKTLSDSTEQAEKPKATFAIGAHAFSGCAKLASIELPEEGLTLIPESLFEGCTALKELTIPACVTNIGGKAFKDSGLETLKYLGTSDLSGLKNLDIPESTTVYVTAEYKYNTFGGKTVSVIGAESGGSGEGSNSEGDDSEGLGAGAIAGIVIAVVVVVAAIGFCVYWFVIRHKPVEGEGK